MDRRQFLRDSSRIMAAAAGWTAAAAPDRAAAVRGADVVVTCTPSKEPLVGLEDVAPGTFVAGMGADNPEKHELAPSLLCGSRVVVDSLDQAIGIIRRSEFGNATSIFTDSGKAAREFRYRAEVSMMGINIGVAAPMSFFSFGGTKGSFFGDLKAHGRDAIEFYTDKKMVISRWF